MTSETIELAFHEPILKPESVSWDDYEEALRANSKKWRERYDGKVAEAEQMREVIKEAAKAFELLSTYEPDTPAEKAAVPAVCHLALATLRHFIK